MNAFPSSHEIIEANRRAAAEALEGFWPTLLIWLALSLAIGFAVALAWHELVALDMAWRPV